MGFATGTVSFRRFNLYGKGLPEISQATLDALNKHILKPGDIGVPEEVEWGWSGGSHLYDGEITFEKNVFAGCIHFALRVDTNRVPASMRQAWLKMEENAVAANNPSGFISKNQRTQARDAVRKKVEEELRTGKHRRSRLVPVLLDVENGVLYANAHGSTLEMLTELMERTLGVSLLEPICPATVAFRHFRRQGEEAKPTRFVMSYAGESHMPDYPWVAKGPQPKNFLGNEFLLWIWHQVEKNGGHFDTSAGAIAAIIDRQIEVECAYGQTGRDVFRGDYCGRLPEAIHALANSKVPRSLGLVLDVAKDQYSLQLADSFAVTRLRLPDIEEADTPRVVFEERIQLLRSLCSGIDALFFLFLTHRFAGDDWASSIRRWITRSNENG
jgi:hypothetical protein